jgi:hypothetical protein
MHSSPRVRTLDFSWMRLSWSCTVRWPEAAAIGALIAPMA